MPRGVSPLDAMRKLRRAVTRSVTLGNAGVRALNDQMAKRVAARGFASDNEAEYSVALVHAGGPLTTYQMRQWVRPLNDLDEYLRGHGLPGAAIVVRDPRVMRECSDIAKVPVVLAWGMAEVIEALGRPSVRVALYANNNTLNFQAMAAQLPAHVHVGHGESDKASMVSNQLRAYDAALIAGQGARDRLNARLVGLERVALYEVGRPQMDFPDPPPEHVPATSKRTVFYAPTWEGDRPEMSYSSVASCGAQVVTDLVAAGYRVIYRPHPQTGRNSALHAAADRKIRRILQEAGSEHLVDDRPGLGWQWGASDAAVLDVSAMAFDALAADLPTVVIAPEHEKAERVSGGILESLVVMDPAARGTDGAGLAEGAGICDLLKLAEREEAVAERRRCASYYFGDVSPGAQRQRFIDACWDILVKRDQALADELGIASVLPSSS